MSVTDETKQLSLAELVGPIAWTYEEIGLSQLPEAIGPEPEASMIRSAAQIGILSPILVYPDGDTYGVLDGNRRIAAARAAELETIPARVFESEPKGQAFVSLVANDQRSSNPLVELWSIQSLIDQGYSEQDICRYCGVSPQTIRKRLRLVGLIPDFMNLFEQGDLSTSIAEALARLPDPVQQEVWRRFADDGDRLSHELIRDVKLIRRDDYSAEVLPGLTPPAPRPSTAVPDLVAMLDTVRQMIWTDGSSALAQKVDAVLGQLEARLHALEHSG